MKKVKVNATYRFFPCGMDRFDGIVKEPRGTLLKVVNQYGCPPANTMGQCYVEKDGKFLGMVSVASLHSKTCSISYEDDKLKNYCSC